MNGFEDDTPAARYARLMSRGNATPGGLLGMLRETSPQRDTPGIINQSPALPGGLPDFAAQPEIRPEPGEPVIGGLLGLLGKRDHADLTNRPVATPVSLPGSWPVPDFTAQPEIRPESDGSALDGLLGMLRETPRQSPANPALVLQHNQRPEVSDMTQRIQQLGSHIPYGGNSNRPMFETVAFSGGMNTAWPRSYVGAQRETAPMHSRAPFAAHYEALDKLRMIHPELRGDTLYAAKATASDATESASAPAMRPPAPAASRQAIRLYQKNADSMRTRLQGKPGVDALLKAGQAFFERDPGDLDPRDFLHHLHTAVEGLNLSRQQKDELKTECGSLLSGPLVDETLSLSNRKRQELYVRERSRAIAELGGKAPDDPAVLQRVDDLLALKSNAHAYRNPKDGKYFGRSDAQMSEECTEVCQEIAANQTRTLAQTPEGMEKLRKAFSAYEPESWRDIKIQADISSIELTKKGAPSPENEPLVLNAAQRYGLSAPLVMALMIQESDQKGATSRTGARGLMQVMPEALNEVVKRYPELAKIPGLFKNGKADPEALKQPSIGIEVGTAYFKICMDKFHGDAEKALAAYNWRIAEVSKPTYSLDNAPEETRRHVDFIKQILWNTQKLELPKASVLHYLSPEERARYGLQ